MRFRRNGADCRVATAIISWQSAAATEKFPVCWSWEVGGHDVEAGSVEQTFRLVMPSSNNTGNAPELCCGS